MWRYLFLFIFYLEEVKILLLSIHNNINGGFYCFTHLKGTGHIFKGVVQSSISCGYVEVDGLLAENGGVQYN